MFGEDGMMHELLVERFNYCIYVVLLLIGLYAMIAKNNLIKKLIGMSIFQTAIILFYVSVGVKEGATIPIYKAEHDPHGHHVAHQEGNQSVEGNASTAGDLNATDAESGALHSGGDEEHAHGPAALTSEETTQYANPLPHVLMLTAIVVGVATLGVALALTQRIYRAYGTIEEDELMLRLEEEADAVGVAAGPAKPKRSRAKSRKGKKA